MPRNNRLLALALCGLLALAPMAALAAEDLNPVGELPIAKQTTKLSILMAQDTLVEDYETNAFTRFIEESCNVDLDFVLLPAADAGDKLAVMISSGQALPDVVNHSLNMDTTYRYAQTGAFLQLDDYYAQYAVNFPKAMTTYPEFEIQKNITCPDGHLYSVPIFAKGLHDEMKYKYWINATWLDKLGLDKPATTEEFYEVLKAFKEQDPNGNGKQDEYPLVGATGWSQDPTIFLMNSFIYDDSTDRFIVQDGRIDVAYTKDAWKEGLLYMRRLVEENLLSPLSFTQDDAQLRALVNNEEVCIAGTFAFSSITLLPVATSPYVNDFWPLEPLAGPEGVRGISYAQTIPTNRWFITADCENPVLAFRVGDFMFDPTEEVFLRARYGVEGEHWSRPAEGALSTFDGGKGDFKAMFVQDVNIWTLTQNAHWRNNAPLFCYRISQGETWNGDPLYFGRRIGQIVNLLNENYRPAEGTYVATLIFNEEETNRISEIRATLRSYVRECEVRFITRDMDIETEWENYLKEIERIGLAEFLSVCQTAYDRMQGE